MNENRFAIAFLRHGLALAAVLCLASSALAQLAPPPKLLPQVTPKPAPTPTPMAAPATAPTPTATPRWCEDDCLVGPTKPLRFELLAGERASSGFAVRGRFVFVVKSDGGKASTGVGVLA